MKEFVFGLETLLRHRRNLEEKESLELSRLLFKLQTEINRRDNLRGKERDTLVELALKRCANADHQELHWFYLYLDRLHLELREWGKRIAELEKLLTAQKAVVVEASKNTKVLENLRARKEREFRFAEEKQEQKDSDELVITRFAHKEIP